MTPYTLIGAIVGFFGIFGWMALAAHEAGANQPPQTIEQQRATEAQQRRDRAAYAICRNVYGPDAVVLWTNTRDMVCRRAKPSNLL